MNDNFKFYLPIDTLEKAYDKDGKEIMKIGGIASTSEKDTDGEFLSPEGFDVSYFMKSGFFNYHHGAKSNPDMIIGEPTKAEITKDGLYVEGFLYPDNKLAKSVYETAKMLEKNSKSRRLGFSIEGIALKRKNEDKNHPDFKFVEKAAITGCAITFSPKNPKTFMDIIKGGVDDSYQEERDENEDKEIEKMLEAGSVTGTETTNKTDASGAPLKLDSVSQDKKGKVKENLTDKEEDEETKENGGNQEILTKSLVLSKIFDRYTDISLNIADKLCKNIFNTMKKKEITGEELNKALEKMENQVELNKADTEEKEKEDEKEEKVEKTSEVEELKKALSDLTDLINEKNHAVGVILKGIYDANLSLTTKVEEIEKSITETVELQKSLTTDLNKGNEGDSTELIKAMEKFTSFGETLGELKEELSDIKKSIDSTLDAPVGRKSVTGARPVDRNFMQNDLSKGQEGNFISVNNKKQVLDILDKATFEKGFDSEFADAMTTFENRGVLSEKVLSRLRNEKGVTIQ